MQEDKNAIYQMRFPQKLWYLLNLRTDAILWGGTGRTILLNYRVLHTYLQCVNSIFKTTNISSFVRQLNLYGFRKVTSHLQDPLCNSSNPYMHEYIHDYFQFGKPELLNKITRKALTIKRNMKSKNIFSNSEQNMYFTPLQKARRAFRIALKKASQDLFLQKSPKQMSTFSHDYGDIPGGFCEGEENIEVDWVISNISNVANKKEMTAEEIQEQIDTDVAKGSYTYKDQSQQAALMSFNDDFQNTDSFPTQFLSMPNLDTDSTEQNCGVELLAEFNIEDDNDNGIAKRIGNKEHDHHSLNCVLPSISNEQNDDVSITQKHDTNNHYGEWDQVFNDIITRESTTSECSTNIRELYSQISQTIHL